MLRTSLSSNRSGVVKDTVFQCIQASSSHCISTAISILSDNSNSNNASVTYRFHRHCRDNFIQLPTTTGYVSPIQNVQLIHRRFKSGSPFPSLQNHNDDNQNALLSSNRNIDTYGEKASGSSSPWKHLNIAKASEEKNYLKNNINNWKSASKSIDNSQSRNTNKKYENSKVNNVINKQLQNKQKHKHPNQTMNSSNEKPFAIGSKAEPPSTLNTNKPLHPIDKLGDYFMQSLQSDRERRREIQQQNNDNKNADSESNSASSSMASSAKYNTESQLDQLLRMSRQKSRLNNYYNNNHDNTTSRDSHMNNRNNTKSGAKAFRERRKMQQQQQLQQQQRHQQQQNQSKGLESYQNRMNTNALQQELLRTNASALNHEVVEDFRKDDDDDKIVILPRKDLTLIELSTLFRVHKNKIVKTLRSLGETVPKGLLLTSSNASDDAEEYKIDVDMAELIALELGLDPQRAKRTTCQLNDAERRVLRMRENADEIDESKDVSMDQFPTRPPVVCIMGHVDHGKTTLMDCLRQRALDASGSSNKKKAGKKKSTKKLKPGTVEGSIHKVAGTEAGGITQTVSAFQVELSNSSTDINNDIKPVDKVTFLDTPGHAAFKAMRQSGSNGADVIVLVIAADDGVSPQTVEIINMYKSIARSQPGSISLVVAITKIDKPGIDVKESIMRIENQLMEHDIFSENFTTTKDMEFGGVQIIPVSGLTGEGLDELIEGLILQSEIMELRADRESRAEGLVIDAKMEKGLGVVADCIVRWGTLELGDYVVSGIHGGKVRILNDVNNKSIKAALPSQPVRIVGLKTLPKAGDPFACVQSEEIAKEIIDRREALKAKESHRAEISDEPLDVEIYGGASKKGFMAQNVLNRYGLGDNDQEHENERESNDSIRIPVILKADADGTLAALRDTVMAIQDESKLNLCIDPILIGIGHVTPSDVTMASESGAAIFCFNLKGSKDKVAMSLAASEGVKVRGHDVIYHLLDEAKDVFSTYCPPTPIERIHGKATVKAVFDINNNKHAQKVAGMMVEEGYFYLEKSSKETGSLACHYRVKRGGKIISPDALRANSLRRVKEEVLSVRRGEECGLNLLDYFDVQEGDIIECFSTEMKRIFV